MTRLWLAFGVGVVLMIVGVNVELVTGHSTGGITFVGFLVTWTSVCFMVVRLIRRWRLRHRSAPK